MNQLDPQYQALIKDILETGVIRDDRTGTGTVSKFFKWIDINLQDGFPLITSKRTWFKGVLVEFLWFLKGDTNIRYLIENGVHIWDEWPYKEYLKFTQALEEVDYKYHIDDPIMGCTRPMNITEFAAEILRDQDFANKFGDVGPVYGKQWVNWNNGLTESIRDGSYPNGEFKWRYESMGINQIKNCIDALKNNPNSRRIMVNAWNVAEVKDMMLPPCHYGFQFYSEPSNDSDTKKLSLLFNMRSVDSILGMPFDIASYGLMLTLMAHVTGHIPNRLIGVFADTHIYLNHNEGAYKLLDRAWFSLPTLEFNKEKMDIFDFTIEDFTLNNYQHSGKMDFEVSV
jgi:thymidylate synthase